MHWKITGEEEEEVGFFSIRITMQKDEAEQEEEVGACTAMHPTMG